MENNISHLQAKLRATTDSNKNKPATKVSNFTQPQISRFTLHTSQLPKPQLPERVIETKTAKTLVNNSRKILATLHSHGDTDSSKEGSLTEDSGVGSHTSSGNYDNMQNIVNLECSPVVRRNSKPRNLEVVVSGNKFDVRDFDDNSLVEDVSLPSLPSVLQAPQNTGIVQERKLEYQWNLNRDNRRKISLTSSEGFSDEFPAGDNRERYRNEKNTSKTVPPPKTFLKPKRIINSSSPFGSSSEDWAAGEAMADDISCSISSSDDGKDREKHSIGVVIHNLAQASIAKTQAKTEGRFVRLSIEDPKFAAVAAASTSSTLLQDETSPTDSLMGSYTESDEMQKNKYNNRSSSDSKDINEKLSFTPPSPGSPTNATNSFSLSDGKDFFVDDEIADQPALVFDDAMTNENQHTFNSIQQQVSEGTSTLIDSTPKSRRRSADAMMKESPLPLRKKFLVHRSGSVDTLSPCESIASDDLMMDFEYSQSSGLDDLGDR